MDQEDLKVGALCKTEPAADPFQSPLSHSLSLPVAGVAYQTAIDIASDSNGVTGTALPLSTAPTLCSSDGVLPPPPAFARLFGYDGGSVQDSTRRRRKLHQFHANTQNVMDLRRVNAASAAAASAAPLVTSGGNGVASHDSLFAVASATMTSSADARTCVDCPVHRHATPSQAQQNSDLTCEHSLPHTYGYPSNLHPSQHTQPHMTHARDGGNTVVVVPVPSRRADMNESCSGCSCTRGAGPGRSGPSQILDFLYLGSVEDARDAAFLTANNIRYIVNVSEEEYWATDRHIVIFPFRARDANNFDISTFFGPTRQILDRVRKAYYANVSTTMTHSADERGGGRTNTNNTSNQTLTDGMTAATTTSSALPLASGPVFYSASNSHVVHTDRFTSSARSPCWDAAAHAADGRCRVPLTRGAKVSEDGMAGATRSNHTHGAVAADTDPERNNRETDDGLSLLTVRQTRQPQQSQSNSGDVSVCSRPGPRVLVHCQRGRSRSATIVLAYLIYRNGWSVAEALHYVMQRRPCAQPNLGFMQALRQLQESMATSLRSQLCSQQSVVLTNIRADTSTDTIRRFFEQHVGLVRGVVVRRSTGTTSSDGVCGAMPTVTSKLACGNSSSSSSSSNSDQDYANTNDSQTQHGDCSSGTLEDHTHTTDGASPQARTACGNMCPTIGDAVVGDGAERSIVTLVDTSAGQMGQDTRARVGVAKEATELRMVFFGCTESVRLARAFAARHPAELQELRPIEGKSIKILVPNKIVAPTSQKEKRHLSSSVKAHPSPTAVNSVCATRSRTGVSSSRNGSLSPLHQHGQVCPAA